MATTKCDIELPNEIYAFLQKYVHTSKKIDPRGFPNNIKQWFDQNNVLPKYIVTILEHYNNNTPYIYFPRCAQCNSIIKQQSVIQSLRDRKTKATFCSVKCCMNNPDRKQNAQNTCLKKYGSKTPLGSQVIREKIKQTNIERYGVLYPAQNPEIHDKQTQTMRERYGCSYVLQTENGRAHLKNVLKERYGVEHYSQSKEWIKKVGDTSMKNWGVDCPLKSEIIRKEIEKTVQTKYGHCVFDNDEINTQFRQTKRAQNFETNRNRLAKKLIEIEDTKEQYTLWPNAIHYRCLKCSTKWESCVTNAQSVYCPICHKDKQSLKEHMLVQLVKTKYKGSVNQNKRGIIGKKELDIFLPEDNIAFEFNGIYWHSTKRPSIDQWYHYNKSWDCLIKNITLYHIFEYMWDLKYSAVLSLIDRLVTHIDVGKCQFRCNVDLKNIVDFININSLVDIDLIDASDICAIIYNQTIVAVSYNKNNFWHVIEGPISVKNLYSKLSQIYNTNLLVDFATTDVVSILRQGFTIISKTEPQYKIINNHKIYDSGSIILRK